MTVVYGLYQPEKALRTSLSLHADLDDDAWPDIRKGAAAPVCSVGKVVRVLPPKREAGEHSAIQP